MVKPFEMLELLERVGAVLRRTQRASRRFALDGVHVDFESRQVFLHGQPVECTPKEFDLLEALIQNRNIALSRDKLLELAWGCDYAAEGDQAGLALCAQDLRNEGLPARSSPQTEDKLEFAASLRQLRPPLFFELA